MISVHFASPGQHVVVTAETHGQVTTLLLQDLEGSRVQLSMDRATAEAVHLLIGRELLAQDQDEIQLRHEFRVGA